MNKQSSGLKPQSKWLIVPVHVVLLPLFNFFFSRNNYKGYSLESKLHFRIHAALSQLKTSNGDPVPEADNGDSVMGGLSDGFQEPTSTETKRTTKL